MERSGAIAIDKSAESTKDNVPTGSTEVEDHNDKGGWGYGIVFSVFLMQILFTGWLQLQSFFFVEWQKDLQASSLQASWLISVGILTVGLLSK